ncbi:BHLH domain-containing protein [Mycena venus]|uniref:BHLH domain-containing protein n=1 Tax=Mycena venus TaxID=2733690 RepID=A0A8H6X9Y8_9AGAR|nr:BHLH domain-containing protein [Mycena venus]
MSLLTKTEANSFNSFLDHALDTMDYENGMVGREWAISVPPSAATSPKHKLSTTLSAVYGYPFNRIYFFVLVHVPPRIFPPSPVVRRPSPKHTQSAPAAPPTKRPRTVPPPAKPALLSPSQKKANHIQSEQKRRANIRRGYEALCEVVPSLRDAIREEEALTAAQHPPPASAKGKRGRGRGRQDDNGEKVDGRAGPRSENVVLSKTIDYMNELLADRDALQTRLDRARSVLPPGHPARTPLQSEPLWEREWKGGVGHADEEGEDDDDDSS